ncbi:hypothetical protein J437_LFUL003202 [Ladona fulva]|uniref:2,3-bisphosphoglycerate 3-phosphatase n=1 Tax=Ladona fulva TaxID=123851 RepID=A0A8K0NYH1_LADFU|nr:hypothetical protein J437_LFUL003202 [Ladona fulva]
MGATMAGLRVVISLNFFVIFSTIFTLSHEECLLEKSNYTQYLGAKTPYRVRMNTNMDPIGYLGCEPLQFWTIIRHGTRYPSSKVIRNMMKNLPLLKDKILGSYNEGKGELCEYEADLFTEWTLKVEEANEKQLAHEGEDEMKDLGERWLQRLPSLLTESYDNNSYEFRHTATQRTALSARSFAIGLFGRHKAAHVWYPQPIAKDPLIRFYKLCSRWKKDVDKNPASLVEKLKFKETQEMKAVVQRVSIKLGLNSLTYDDIHLMFITCGFETAWNKYSKSPWCAAFSEEDLKLLDFKSIASGKGSQKKGIFYFTHSGALLKLISLLGLYKDEETLRSDNFDDLKYLKRRWRVSYLDSFGTNLAFVLFRCSDDFKIAGYHQERPFIFPGCDATPCSLSKVRNLYRDAVFMCEFDQTCSLARS